MNFFCANKNHVLWYRDVTFIIWGSSGGRCSIERTLEMFYFEVFYYELHGCSMEMFYRANFRDVLLQCSMERTIKLGTNFMYLKRSNHQKDAVF